MEVPAMLGKLHLPVFPTQRVWRHTLVGNLSRPHFAVNVLFVSELLVTSQSVYLPLLVILC